MSAHLLYRDFLRFIEALAASGDGDPWELYERHYLDPHREVLTAYWGQCLGLPQQVWRDRVRRVRPEEYGLLADLVRDEDLAGIARQTLARCQNILPMQPEPDVYFLVGFFSPDGFAFQVHGDWSIGIGLERLSGLRLLPVLLAHEYAHCYRRRLGQPTNLGERLVDEGFAVEMSARALPERPEADHLLMRPGQAAAMANYQAALWTAIRERLSSEDEQEAARILYGRPEKGRWPSRAGRYLGWRLVRSFIEECGDRFDAPAEDVLSSAVSH